MYVVYHTRNGIVSVTQYSHLSWEHTFWYREYYVDTVGKNAKKDTKLEEWCKQTDQKNIFSDFINF